METIRPEFKATLSGSLLRFALEEFLKEIDDKKTYFAVIEERISYDELTAAEVAARNLRKEMSRIEKVQSFNFTDDELSEFKEMLCAMVEEVGGKEKAQKFRKGMSRIDVIGQNGNDGDHYENIRRYCEKAWC